MKIVSFGDSFVFGSELKNNPDGSMAWPSLVAKKINVDYQTYSDPGCGNDAIAQQIYTHFADNTAEDDLAIINWTWTSRWDMYIGDCDTWITVDSNSRTEKLQRLLGQTQLHQLIELYNNYLNKSLLWNKIRNLQTIFSAQQYLKIKKINSIQTFMDYELFTTEFHAPPYVKELQKLVVLEMRDWGNGLNFLDWSKNNNFFITEIGWHPLEDAHIAAADFWLPVYRDNLCNNKT